MEYMGESTGQLMSWVVSRSIVLTINLPFESTLVPGHCKTKPIEIITNPKKYLKIGMIDMRNSLTFFTVYNLVNDYLNRREFVRRLGPVTDDDEIYDGVTTSVIGSGAAEFLIGTFNYIFNDFKKFKKEVGHTSNEFILSHLTKDQALKDTKIVVRRVFTNASWFFISRAYFFAIVNIVKKYT
jgi:hypothetical protein